MGKWFHRRSLTLATISLLLGLFTFAQVLGFSFRMRPPSASYAVWTLSIFVLAATFCIHATVNLVRDVDRGYPPARCSLAAVILLFALLLIGWTGFGLAGFILRNS
ncbi:MAG: hypothetical protein AB9869_18535 [Verrucomicrobiia bacterium]